MRSASFPLAGVLLLAVVGADASARADSKLLPWDAERVLELAQEVRTELAQALEAAREAAPQEMAIQQRSRDALVRRVDRVLGDVDELIRKLRQDFDRDESIAYFRVVLERARQAIDMRGDAVAHKKPWEHWRAAGRLAGEMDRYYGVTE